ncbi:MAG TPA: TIGR00266 family protein, partial [Euryarchaeota archaeon]|nr:TIGR00266 family protein [Euryarchaeota archaeon]
SGHIVGFSDNMDFKVRRVGGLKSTLLSGEGLVSDFTGPGKLLIQTRHFGAFARQLVRYLPQQQHR